MKHTYTILFLVICFSANAQIHIGARGGVSIPSLEGNSEQSKGYVSRQGVYGGLLVNFPVTRGLSLQPEINFSPQGGQRNGMQQVPSGAIHRMSFPAGLNLYAKFKNTTILNYLEIPILVKVTLGRRLKYYALFGPYISFLLEAKTKTRGNSFLYLDEAGTSHLSENGNPLPAVSFNSNTGIKKSIKTVNAGAQGGLGFEYPAGRGRIFLEGRTIMGITNIQTNPESDGKNQTGSLVIAIGYKIKL